MRVAAVSMVKNECDVMELFVRINARVVDHFFVLDDASTDTTPAILRRLRREGYPITVWSHDTFGYEQAPLTNAAVRRVAGLSFDWIMPLDADEFVGSGLKRELAGLPPDGAGKLMLRNFIPLADAYAETPAPLWALFRARRREPIPSGKVVLSKWLAQRAVLRMGNHEAYHRSGRQLPAHTLATRLDHVPVRSAPQLVSKILIGVHKAALRPRRAEELRHWELIADLLRRHQYRLDGDLLQTLAFLYSAPGIADTDLSDDPTGIGAPTDVVRYPELARIDTVGRFDSFAASLVTRIRGPQSPRRERLRETLREVGFRSRRKLGWL